MKLRNKLSYMALGGLLMLIGMLASSVFMPNNLIAQRDKFGDIECNSLRVVDADGAVQVILSANWMDKWNTSGVWIGNNSYGGHVVAKGNDGKREASLSVDVKGGVVDVFGNDKGERMASIGCDILGGFVGTKGTDGFPKAFIGAGEHGGYFKIKGKYGVPMAMLNIDEHGGHVNVYSTDQVPNMPVGVDEHDFAMNSLAFSQLEKRVPKALLSVTEHGGHVQVMGNGEAAAAMAINEYGNGAVSTWDKNGYRQ